MVTTWFSKGRAAGRRGGGVKAAWERAKSAALAKSPRMGFQAAKTAYIDFEKGYRAGAAAARKATAKKLKNPPVSRRRPTARKAAPVRKKPGRSSAPRKAAKKPNVGGWIAAKSVKVIRDKDGRAVRLLVRR